MANESPTEIEQLTNAFVDEQWDPTITVREWWARLAGARLVNTTLPVEAGGRGWTGAQAAVVGRVLADRRVVGPPGGLGNLLAAPTIAAHATQEQIDRWVPRILDGTEAWCQLFSEPGAGSDLASLQAKAVRDGDEWVVTGQKVWTSNGHEADWGMLIARTDPDLPKHQGISYFGFPMNQDGVEVRPLTEMTGRALFNEVFIEEARVPDANMIGALGDGWRVANSTLMYERAGIGGGHGGGFGTAAPGKIVGHLDRPVGDFLGKRGAIAVGAVGRRVLGLLSEEAAARGKADDPVVRDGLARLHMLHRIAAMTLKRQAAERRSGRKPTGSRRRGGGQPGEAAQHDDPPPGPRHGRIDPRARRRDRRPRCGHRRTPPGADPLLARPADLRRHRRDPAERDRRARPRTPEGAGTVTRHPLQRAPEIAIDGAAQRTAGAPRPALTSEPGAASMSYEQIRYEQRDEIALLTLDRPERLNAWTARMGRELADAFATANDDPSVGAIVVTGEGRGFCAGADVEDAFKRDLDKADAAAAQSSDGGGDHDRDRSEPQLPTWVQMVRDSKPVLAAVNGVAIGVGLTMILPFDQIIASDASRFSCRFVKMGITPELASSHYLVSRTGWGAASDLALTGRIVDAPEALRLRLVDAVVPADELLDATLAKAREFSANPDPQLRMIKQLLTENADETDIDLIQRREIDALNLALRTPEHREAVNAFIEKREPKFR